MKKTILSIALLTFTMVSAQWTPVNTDLPGLETVGVANVRDTLFTAVKSHGIYYSVNYGDNWAAWKNNSKLSTKEFTAVYGISTFTTDTGGNHLIMTGPSMANAYTSISGGGDLTASVFKSFTVPNETINVWAEEEKNDVEYGFLGTNNGVYYSINGESWIKSTGFSGDALVINKIFVQEYDDDSHAVFASTNAGVYKSTDWGKTFLLFEKGISSTTKVYDQSIFIATSNGMYSYDKDNDIHSPFIPQGDYRTSVLDYTKFMAYAFGDGVATKVNLATASSDILSQENITGGTIISSTLLDNYIFICTESGGVFRMPVDGDLGVGDYDIATIEFSVAPNPSNGNFTITSDESISVELYSSNGVFIKSYNVNNLKTLSENLSSGIYFLKQKGSTNTKKLVIK